MKYLIPALILLVIAYGILFSLSWKLGVAVLLIGIARNLAEMHKPKEKNIETEIDKEASKFVRRLNEVMAKKN